MPNTLTLFSYNGIEIYQNEVDIIISEFINIYGIDIEQLYKTNTYISLLSYIRKKLISNIVTKNNGTNNNGYDYKLLDEIHDTIFLYVSGKFNHSPSLQNFSLLTGISNDYLTEVMSGQYNNGSRVNPENTRIVKKWFEHSRAATTGKAEDENSIGAMYIAKAVFGLRENDPQVVTQQIQQTQTPEQIAERYKDVKKPELPQLDN